MIKNVISISRETAEFVRQAHMKTGLVCLTGCVLGCPVDTGRARFNFIVTQNGPSFKTRPTPSEPVGGNAAIELGKAVLDETVPYSITAIENNLVYIEALNNGHSKQARPGFIERAINRAIQIG